MSTSHQKHKCEICHKEFSSHLLFPLRIIRSSVLDAAKKLYPNTNCDGYICQKDLHKIRTDHIEGILEENKGALSQFDQEVLSSMRKQDVVAENVNKKFERALTFGERLSDYIAQFGGSWKFILSFVSMILIWMILNTFFFKTEGFDPYPFILLNLVLSCLAALQAPIIMMSQNRQAEKEHLQANEDYITNLKAELEIQQLHSKLDLFLKNQWETLIELQKIQIELFDEVLHNKNKKGR
jgi:uncharacterized membrane protein